MNIEEGARTLELAGNQRKVQIPRGFQTFSEGKLPDFLALYGDQRFTLRLGKRHQGWMNGTLARLITQAQTMVSDNVRQEKYVYTRPGIQMHDVDGVVDEALRKLELAPYWPTRREELLGVSYLSWDLAKGDANAHVDASFIVGVEPQGSDRAFTVQIGRGHLDGWDAYDPPQKYPRGITQDPIVREIISGATTLSEIAYVRSDGAVAAIIAEGVVMNGSFFGVRGPMFHDLYEMPVGGLVDLSHASIVKAWCEANGPKPFEP